LASPPLKPTGTGISGPFPRESSLLFRTFEFRHNDQSEVFFAVLGKESLHRVLPLIKQLRDEGLRIQMDYSLGSLKKQMGLSDKLGSRFTLIVGENELKSGKAILRNMQTKDRRGRNNPPPNSQAPLYDADRRYIL